MSKAWFLTTIVALSIGCGNSPQRSESSPLASPNCVATFLAGAERQTETDEQRAEVAIALRDMLTKSPQDLKAARYADYQGKKGVWTARELLQHYYLSKASSVLDDECFYRDVSAADARSALQKRLDDLTKEGK